MKQRFYSKKDNLFTIISFIMILLPIGLAYLFFFSHIRMDRPAPVPVKIILMFVSLSTSLFFLSVWFNTYYEIDNGNLLCRSGPFKKIIQIFSIHSISKPKLVIVNISSSIFKPTLSFKEALIKYNTFDDISVSPADYDGFVNALKMVNPGIIEV